MQQFVPVFAALLLSGLYCRLLFVMHRHNVRVCDLSQRVKDLEQGREG